MTTIAQPIRRKPKFTFLSPSPSDTRGPLNLLPTSSKPVPSPTPDSSPALSLSGHAKSITTCLKSSMGPPLPLYHPFGKLAMSLPPLDPASLGLSLPINIDDDSGRSSSSHSKRSGVKLRDAAVETDPFPPVATSVNVVAAIAAREIKSPRKRRAAAGGGGSKRKRNPATDDGEYPAKRSTRQPRNAAPIDEEPGSPEAVDVAGTPAELSDKPERRTTRSRGGAIARRDSTASETPSVSASKDAVPIEEPKEQRRNTSKEEGEVSEESKST